MSKEEFEKQQHFFEEKLARQQLEFGSILAAKERENQSQTQQHLDALKTEMEQLSTEYEQQRTNERATWERERATLQKTAAQSDALQQTSNVSSAILLSRI